MKKLIYSAAALATLLFAGSCQRENLELDKTGSNTVTYTVEVPGTLSTKVIGEDVSGVTELIYEVYRTEATETEDHSQTETLLYQKTATLTNGKAIVELELVNNQNFRVLFWAQVPETGIYNTQNLKEVSLKTVLDANQENYSAFSGADYIKFGDNLAGRTIKLKRPIAQLNIATSAESLVLGEGGSKTTNVNVTGSGILVNGLSTSYNVATAETGNDAVEFVYNTKPVSLTESTISVNGTEYNYLSMNYVGFAEKTGTNVTVDYSIITDNVGTIKNKIENVPVKANHRTNIIGNLITSTSDYTIILDEKWEQTEYVGPEFVEQPAYDEATKTWTITNADELAWVAASVNGTLGVQTKAGGASKNFSGEIIVLANDIDLQGAEWDPIGNQEHAFAGTFDGQNNTVSNFKVTEKAGWAGLFGRVQIGTVKNLNVKNVTIETNHYAGAIVGQGYVYIDNCHAENVNITVSVDPEADGGKGDYGDKAGGLVGQNCEGGLKITKSSAKNVVIEGYRDLGGIVGMAHDRNVVTDNSVENITIIQNLENSYNTTAPTTLGAVIGRRGSNITENNNTETDPIIIKTAIVPGVYPIDKDEEGNVTEYGVYSAEGLEWVAASVTKENSFEGVTVKLTNDIELPTDKNWEPIGDNRTDAAFKGTFDGDNHTIKGAKITGSHCWDGSVYGSKEGWGLFSVVDGAEIKNLNIDDAVFASYTVISGSVAGYAHDTTFENITINNTKISGYNWYTGGVVGWASGNCTFKGIDLNSSTSVGTLWDSHGQCAGGIAGGISSTATIVIEDCNIACVLDVINDVTSNYKWWIYRVSGMIIGNISTTQTIDDRVYPDPSNVTCKNVTVTYGDWMNYHYCQGYWNRGWGRVESSDYVDGIDHTQCNHPDGESHYVCIPFDQLFGGGPNGDGRNPVYGLKEYPGVTVKYPATEGPKLVESANDLTTAIANGEDVVLPAPMYDGEGNITNGLNMGTTQLTIDKPVTIDLNGNNLTTANNWGGITLKNGASIKNGTINHTGNTAAIKAWNVESIENVTINVTPTDGKVKGGIVIQSGADSRIGTLKNVTISGTTNGIETYNCGGTDDTPAIDYMENVTIDATDTGILLSAHIGKAKNCSIKGAKYGINMHLKGEYKVGIELDACTVTGAEAALWGHDEKGISNTNNCSLTLTYDAETIFNGPFIWDFEDECQSVVTLNALK